MLRFTSPSPTTPPAVQKVLREGEPVAAGTDLGRAINKFVRDTIGKPTEEQGGTLGVRALKELLGRV